MTAGGSVSHSVGPVPGHTRNTADGLCKTVHRQSGRTTPRLPHCKKESFVHCFPDGDAAVSVATYNFKVIQEDPPMKKKDASKRGKPNETVSTLGHSPSDADVSRSSQRRDSRRADQQGGETHQKPTSPEVFLSSNQGLPISDNQNSLKAGKRGPSLLEDFILREKITHFDHERIPERIVHARGVGAHGYFQPYKSMKDVTKAAFLSDPKVKTPVFVRFSTVAGERGSADLPRDVRGFATKFYTSEGNFDLVGNNIPVFFIQDAIKFPDLIHSVKPEPDRAFPQAASAHDTFWDFISLMPESMHMIMWAMSDRAIPRSLRMMEGFGIHTFRLINEAGEQKFVKFHWRPKLANCSVVWDEALKINGADPDFHRRDLWDAISSGKFPEYELGLQIFDQEFADKFEFDVLDATKIIPEETIPLEMVGKLVLDRNVDNFFAETEQVAFCPSHIVPGIDFSEDPLLQGRLFSYLDTQLSRLGGPNFHQIPVNAPKCPFHNLQRDGLQQMSLQRGRVAYEPNSLDPDGPRESTKRGFRTSNRAIDGNPVRLRSESFADHYSQARLFYRSQSKPEQKHLAQALMFELSKVETEAIRFRMLGHLTWIDEMLAEQVARGLGAEGKAEKITPAREPIELPPSPALSLYSRKQPNLEGRKVGILLGAGFDAKTSKELVAQIEKEKANVALITPKIQGAEDSAGVLKAGHMALRGAPSVLFDAVAVLSGARGDEDLAQNPNAVSFLRDAFRHGKAIAWSGIPNLSKKANLKPGDGLVDLDGRSTLADFIAGARKSRFWERESETPDVV
jgi:catalase